MESQRQQKVSRLLQKELAHIFQHEMSFSIEGSQKAFISVTTVKVSPDLSVANIYLSIFLAKNPRYILQQINEQAKAVKHNLSRKLRDVVRIVPELRFFIDDTAEEAEKIDALLAKIKPPETE